MQSRPVLTLQAVNEEVNDAAWCPACSTVLASATAGGRLELWKLAQSVVKPAALHCAPQVRHLYSCIVLLKWRQAPGLELKRRGELSNS